MRGAAVGGLLLEHRPALVADEQVVHVIRVLFLLRQDPLEQHTGGRVGRKRAYQTFPPTRPG